ncbi:hypothetical protein DP1654 [Desulfotalea psychrophila LSv54]|uniref:Beta-phosphoglucomutase n=1 Tax=Desulfotalea psychrophila (strain LSv54 / DSM 12343) TaxID=177439 RepID=Q6AMP2_DESPS|nr:HAD family hydrolase [Desulfotalea psychrophila]CAG36383.1 hypothetical protein DP1654 [Desulfotalea psychrophila LSv54]
MIEALVFDLDGTLVNSEELHFMAWKEILEKHGAGPFTFDLFETYIGTSNEKVATDYISSRNWQISQTDLIREKQDVYIGAYSPNQPLPGSQRNFRAVLRRKILALASSSHEKEVRKILEVMDTEIFSRDHRWRYGQ